MTSLSLVLDCKPCKSRELVFLHLLCTYYVLSMGVILVLFPAVSLAHSTVPGNKYCLIKSQPASRSLPFLLPTEKQCSMVVRFFFSFFNLTFSSLLTCSHVTKFWPMRCKQILPVGIPAKLFKEAPGMLPPWLELWPPSWDVRWLQDGSKCWGGRKREAWAPDNHETMHEMLA